MSITEKDIRQAIDIPASGDTISVSERSHISDITFYDSANLITRIDKNHLNGFPYQFIEKNRQQESKSRASLIKQLRDGDDLAVSPFHEDWTVFIILIAAFFYASVPAISRKLFPGVTRFFLFRGIGEAEARDTGELFHWQSTIFNFISFSIIALFTYFVAYSYGALPASISGIFLWLIALGSVVIAITFRHISCIITGRFSGEKEAFDEYIVTFYQSYRYLALILFVLVILLSYTKIFSSRTLFLAGYISFAAFYMLRIVRLFLIFIKRNVSVLYLILYLCALEILPVAVVTKYITGLF